MSSVAGLHAVVVPTLQSLTTHQVTLVTTILEEYHNIACRLEPLEYIEYIACRLEPLEYNEYIACRLEPLEYIEYIACRLEHFIPLELYKRMRKKQRMVRQKTNMADNERNDEEETDLRHSSGCYICDGHNSSSCCTVCRRQTVPLSPGSGSPHECCHDHSDTTPGEISHTEDTDPRDMEPDRNEAQL